MDTKSNLVGGSEKFNIDGTTLNKFLTEAYSYYKVSIARSIEAYSFINSILYLTLESCIILYRGYLIAQHSRYMDVNVNSSS